MFISLHVRKLNKDEHNSFEVWKKLVNLDFIQVLKIPKVI